MAERPVEDGTRAEQLPAKPVAKPRRETLAEGASPTTGEYAPASDGDGVPTTIGIYKVEKLLGQGGMGAVYLAEDPTLQRKVALKVMKPTVAANPVARERFLREARAAAKVESDHIIRVYAVGEDRGMPFIAMEYLKGKPMDAWLKEAKPTVKQILRIGAEAAAGLHAAHKVGLIHRDIKPANLWLEYPTGRVKILDFGLARPTAEDTHLTNTGVVVGTPAYMSPEQGRGKDLDHRTDIFSLGCVLYHLAAGKRPFTGANTYEIIASLIADTPPAPHERNPNVPPELSAAIMQMLEKDPARRPAKARAVAEEMCRLLKAQSQSQIEMPALAPPSPSRTHLPPGSAVPLASPSRTNLPPAPVAMAVPVVEPVPMPTQATGTTTAWDHLDDSASAVDVAPAEPGRKAAGRADKKAKGKKKPRTALVLLLAVAGAAVIAGGAAIAYFVLRQQNDVAGTTAPTSPSTAKPRPPKELSADRKAAPVLAKHFDLKLRGDIGNTIVVGRGQAAPSDREFTIVEIAVPKDADFEKGFVTKTLLPAIRELRELKKIANPDLRLRLTEDEFEALGRSPCAESLTEFGVLDLTKRNLETLRGFAKRQTALVTWTASKSATDDLVAELCQICSWSEAITIADFDKCGLTAKSVGHLLRRPLLAATTLAFPPGDKESLDLFGSAAELKSLTLHVKTDAAAVLAGLQKIPKLASLSLLSCPELTDDTLQLLAPVPTLRELTLSAAFKNITDTGVAKLAKANPKLKIVWGTHTYAPTKGDDFELLAKAGDPQPGEVRSFEIAPGVVMKFCWIPRGRAKLGTPPDEDGRASYEREVKEHMLDGFWLGKYEVTQQEYQAVTGANPSHFSAGGGGRDKVKGMDTTRFPVENVNYDECVEFTEKLAKIPDAEKVFGPNAKFRLPSRTEHEYATRGGNGVMLPFYFGRKCNGNEANVDGTKPYGAEDKGPCLERTCEVGSYEAAAPHPWGLCDVVGNVDEFTTSTTIREGKTAFYTASGQYKQGPSWGRSGTRNSLYKDKRSSEYGLRVIYVPGDANPPAAMKNDGFVPLFNGKDLTGWHIPANERYKTVKEVKNDDGKVIKLVGIDTDGREVDFWRAENGCLSGERVSLFSDSDYDNFHLRAVVKISDGGDTSIFTRAANDEVFVSKISGRLFPSSGYEHKININNGTQAIRTGSILPKGPLAEFKADLVVETPDNLHGVDQFFKYEVVAEGNRLRIWVNGRIMLDWRDPNNTFRSGRIAPATASGTLTFQSLEIKPLK